jgi:hypothetical protein
MQAHTDLPQTEDSYAINMPNDIETLNPRSEDSKANGLIPAEEIVKIVKNLVLLFILIMFFKLISCFFDIQEIYHTAQTSSKILNIIEHLLKI